MEEGWADILLTYCTNAVLAADELPKLQIIQIPPELSVGAEYGLLVLSDAVEAASFADFVLSHKGQAIFGRFGFGAPAR